VTEQKYLHHVVELKALMLFTLLSVKLYNREDYRLSRTLLFIYAIFGVP